MQKNYNLSLEERKEQLKEYSLEYSLRIDLSIYRRRRNKQI